MTTKRYWADLTTAEFRALDVSRTIAVLPVGAIEQHGPHLPVSVDRDIVEEIVARAAPRLDDLPVLFLLVDMRLARDFTSRSEQWARDLDCLGAGATPVKLGWLIQDLNPDGACGNAAAAGAEKGERLLERGVEHFIAMLREIDGMPADDLDAFPA